MKEIARPPLPPFSQDDAITIFVGKEATQDSLVVGGHNDIFIAFANLRVWFKNAHEHRTEIVALVAG